MKNDTKKVNFAKILSKKLLDVITDQENFLKEENQKITQDSSSSIEHDIKFVKKYLIDYTKNLKKTLKHNLKPKGKIFLILSFNEPFILSIVPILNALIAGNNLIIKPSGKCSIFFRKVWSELIIKFKLPIEIIEKPNDFEITEIISQVTCVYFFGSYENAKKLYQTCSELFVEFIPEIETADCKIFKFELPNDTLINNDCKSTLLQAFSHAGQTCQRISGIFIHKNNFAKYQEKIESEFKILVKDGISRLIPDNFIINDTYKKKILLDIHNSNPTKIIESDNSLSKIVINPSISSDFILNGYFYPVLWLISFTNFEELLNYLNNRRFYLGLNIMSDDKKFIDCLINNTKFTRYTVNKTHTNIRTNEGWGGRWPSGTGGYKNWIEHFSISYNII